ncbi:unnamed protein product [Diamesa hyperborea]
MHKFIVLLLFVGVYEVTFGQECTSETAIRKFFQEIGTHTFTNNLGRRQTKTYFISRYVKLSWANAFSFCKANDMNLVELHTKQEADNFLTILRTSATEYWYHIGGSYIGAAKNDFYWMTTGERINYALEYHPGQPDNAGGKEMCLSVAQQPGKFKFNDVDCWQHFIWSFVCQQVKDI